MCCPVINFPVLMSRHIHAFFLFYSIACMSRSPGYYLHFDDIIYIYIYMCVLSFQHRYHYHKCSYVIIFSFSFTFILFTFLLIHYLKSYAFFTVITSIVCFFFASVMSFLIPKSASLTVASVSSYHHFYIYFL